MINPNKEHLLTGRIVKNESNGVREIHIESGGHLYKGYDASPKLQAGDVVTFRVSFSIVADSYTIVKGSVWRKRKRKPIIMILDKHTDSFGTLHVKFVDLNGQIKEVYFDEGDHHFWDKQLAKGGK